MHSPLIFLLGYVRFRISHNDAARVVNILGRGGKIYRNFIFDGEYAFFECSFASYRSVYRICAEHGVKVEAVARRGIPYILYRYRHRYGVFIGAWLFVLITVLSSMVLWDIRIIGNSETDVEKIKADIRNCGLREGDLLFSINTPELENLVLIESDHVAWISINIIGTVAEIEIREEREEPQKEQFDYVDLVASRDGVIELFEQTRGNALVNIGDAVSKGDVLISGYYPADETVGERFAVAKGRVLARVKRDFSVSVPLEYEAKVYSEREKCEKFFIFFGKEIKFFGNSGNLYANCDTINTVDYFEMPKGVLLPFGVRTVRYMEYSTVGAKRSPQAAEELARYRLRCLMADGINDGILLRKNVRAVLKEDSFELVCQAEYIENIAERKGYIHSP